jgi:hypothetical protein
MFKATNSKKGHASFTLTEGHLLREIITDCRVSLPFDPSQGLAKHPPMIDTRALWDTGATNCAITPELIAKLRLAPFDKANVQHADGMSLKDVYKINVILPTGVGFSLLNVTECKSAAGNFELIIGMDVITAGDFAITNKDGKTMVSYRHPSSVQIDFNEGGTIITPGPNSTGTAPSPSVASQPPYPGTAQNAPCPCGSGKKYKRCHGFQ